MLQHIKKKLRQRETYLWQLTYQFLKKLQRLNSPVIRPMHAMLRHERMARHALWGGVLEFLYYVPVFKTYCSRCGNNLKIYGGMPQVDSLVEMEIGDNVTLHAALTIVAGCLYEKPVFKVGNNTHLGYQVTISIGEKVIIGDNVLISNLVNILSYDGHPVDPQARLLGMPPEKTGNDSIVIEDNVWIGVNCTILKGVTIGRNSVVAAGSIVTSSVPENCVVAGNPAKIIRSGI